MGEGRRQANQWGGRQPAARGKPLGEVHHVRSKPRGGRGGSSTARRGWWALHPARLPRHDARRDAIGGVRGGRAERRSPTHAGACAPRAVPCRTPVCVARPRAGSLRGTPTVGHVAAAAAAVTATASPAVGRVAGRGGGVAVAAAVGCRHAPPRGGGQFRPHAAPRRRALPQSPTRPPPPSPPTSASPPPPLATAWRPRRQERLRVVIAGATTPLSRALQRGGGIGGGGVRPCTEEGEEAVAARQ